MFIFPDIRSNIFKIKNLQICFYNFLWWLCNQMFSYDGRIVITTWMIITALTACMKVNKISTEIFVCCKRVLWILTSFQSQCPSILSISIPCKNSNKNNTIAELLRSNSPCLGSFIFKEKNSVNPFIVAMHWTQQQ